MSDPTTIDDLTGKLLIAMPALADPRFDHSVVYMCAHSEDAAMGLIINKPSSEVTLAMLLEQLSIVPTVDVRGKGVHFGGPVEQGRGFVLHSSDYQSALSSQEVTPDFCLTATLDVLEDIARGEGPQNRLMLLGYAGWGAGQLESELAQNAWLVCDATEELVYHTPDARKWEAALASIGVPAIALSAEGGRA